MNENQIPETEFTKEYIAEELIQPEENISPETVSEGSNCDESNEQHRSEESAVPQKESWQKTLFRDAKDVLYILAIFMLVYVLCFRTVVVVGDSMYDTLVNGDRLLLVNNLLYWQPEQGDVIVASKDSFRNGECFIKRVIATEGQTVDINFDTGTVFVDNVALDEPYLHTLTIDAEGVVFPVTVPEGCLFVMGDNREDSLDSRSPSIGFIDKREILGRAIFLMIPGTGTDECPAEFDFSRIGVIG